MIQGQEDPVYLAGLAKGSLRNKISDLPGRLTDHHRFMLITLCDSISSINAQIRQIEARSETHAVALQQAVDRLQTIPGVGKEAAAKIQAETGDGMKMFPDHKHLAS